MKQNKRYLYSYTNPEGYEQKLYDKISTVHAEMSKDYYHRIARYYPHDPDRWLKAAKYSHLTPEEKRDYCIFDGFKINTYEVVLISQEKK